MPGICPDHGHPPRCGRARRSLVAADYWIGVSLPDVVNALGIRVRCAGPIVGAGQSGTTHQYTYRPTNTFSNSLNQL